MIKGSIVALVTPFDEDNKIDYKSVDKLLELQLANNTDGLLLLGTTAESESLSAEEKVELVNYVINYLQGRIKIMLGLISNVPDKIIDMAALFKGLDIDSYLVSSPYYIKSNESGLIKFFTYLADRLDKPIILYNVPKRSGVNLSYDVVRYLSYHHNIIGIKEASGDIKYQTKISNICNENFILYGADDYTMIASLALGASGLISVVGNAFPREVKLIIDSYKRENKISLLTFHKLSLLIEDIFLEASPIPIKYLLYIKGICTNKLRLPLAEASLSLKRKIEEDYLILLDE